MLCISDEFIYIFLGKPPGTWVSVNGRCRGIGYLSEFYFSYRLNKAVAAAHQHPFSFWNTVSLFIFLFFSSRVRYMSREVCVVLSVPPRGVCVIDHLVWVCVSPTARDACPSACVHTTVCLFLLPSPPPPLTAPLSLSPQVWETHQHFSVMWCSQQEDGAK